MSDLKDCKVIFQYSRKQGIDDGTLVEIFKNHWQELSGGKPILATNHLYQGVSLAGLLEIWNEFVEWRTNIMPKLPEEEQMFTTSMNFEKLSGKKISNVIYFKIGLIDVTKRRLISVSKRFIRRRMEINLSSF